MSTFERDLPDHARALRAIARLLVGDRHAEDLVQEASLHALQNPPPRAVPQLAWLRTILRNRASKLHRSERRRRHREQAAAPSPDGTLSPDRLAAHHEEVDRLHRSLRGLPEPYQSTLWLRFFQDATPSAIAAHTGVPLATVKSRLQRGLDLLRQDFARDRDPRAWRSALAGAFALPPDAAAIAATGALAMTTAIKLSLAGGAAAALLLFALWPDQRAPDLDDRATAPTPLPATAAGTATANRPDDDPAARTSLSPTVAALPPIHLRLVDAFDGAPLPEFDVQIADGAQPDDDPPILTSDARGELVLPGDHRRGARVLIALDDAHGSRFVRERHAIAVDQWPAADRTLDVPLTAGPTYALVFVDEPPPDGELVAAITGDAELIFSNHPIAPDQRVHRGPLPWVRFDPRLAQASALGAGPWTLVVTDAERRWLASGNVTTLRGSQIEPVPMHSRACGTLRIAITEDGTPAEGAYHASVYRRGADGEATGRDRTVQIPHGRAGATLTLLPAGDYRVYVGGSNQTESRSLDATIRRGARTEVTAAFPRPGERHTLRVVVRSQTGTRDLGLVVCGLARPDGFSPHHSPQTRVDGTLTYTFADLGPGEWLVRLQPTPHLPPWNTTEQRVLATAGTVEFVCLDDGAPPAGHVRIEVVDGSGKPLQDAGVTTFVDGRSHFCHNTDADGRVWAGPYLSDRPIQVLVRAPDCSAAYVEALPSTDPSAPPVRVALAPGWGTMLIVVAPGDAPGGEPLADVEVLVDGVRTGTTDARGLLLVNSATVPLRIELRRAGYHFAYGALDAATGAPIGGEQAPYFCVMARD